jgi:hypothetical protein
MRARGQHITLSATGRGCQRRLHQAGRQRVDLITPCGGAEATTEWPLSWPCSWLDMNGAGPGSIPCRRARRSSHRIAQRRQRSLGALPRRFRSKWRQVPSGIHPIGLGPRQVLQLVVIEARCSRSARRKIVFATTSRAERPDRSQTRGKLSIWQLRSRSTWMGLSRRCRRNVRQGS